MLVDNELLKKYRQHEKDTGSTVVQIILLSEEIEEVKFHLSTKNEGKNKKDVPAKRALLKKIAYRKSLLYKYLAKNNPEIFQKLRNESKDLVKFLGIKG